MFEEPMKSQSAQSRLDRNSKRRNAMSGETVASPAQSHQKEAQVWLV
jgi:hypothetical protein